MHRDRNGIGALIGEQTCSARVQVDPLGGGEIFIDGCPHHRVDEAQRLPGHQNREVGQAGGQRAGPSRFHSGQPRTQAVPGLLAKHGHRSRECGCLRIEAADAEQDRRGDSFRSKPVHGLGVDLPGRTRAAAKLAQEFCEQERVATRRPGAGATQPLTRVVAKARPDQACHRGLTERPGAKDVRTRFEHQRTQVPTMPVGACSHGQRHHNRQSCEAVRQVKQEPQRRFVGQVRVVDRKYQRAALGQVHDEPVQTVQRGECDVTGLLGSGDVSEHRLGQPRGTGQ